MPDTLSQSKAINEKAAHSAALRRARLLCEKVSRKQQRLQLQARLIAEQAALTRDRTMVNEHLNQQHSNTCQNSDKTTQETTPFPPIH